jgi:hypothetical protein
MKKTKVFISSVITGFKEYRDAAEDAISELNRDKGFNFEAIRIHGCSVKQSMYPSTSSYLC